jgi:hypothetical protein
MEVIDLGLSDLEPISMNFNGDDSDRPSTSVNFGGGLEFLMNDKQKSSSSINIDLGELDRLESELNELSGGGGGGAGKSSSSAKSGGESKMFSGFGNFFGLGGGSSSSGGGGDTKNISIGQKDDSNLGQATVESMGNTKTWDGFQKVNEVPITSSAPTKMTDREKRRKKRAMIKKLEEWYEKGLIKSNSHFTLESNYEEIEDEYETALEDKRKKDSIKLQGWWFMTFVNSIEYANAAFNPFDVNLDGWGEQVNEDIDSYEEIFGELHEKYKGGKLAPEISLLLRLGFSAAVVNFTNKALSSATPGFNDVIKQSPELMKMFTNATVSSMSQQSPGFAFANNMMNQMGQQGPATNMGPPPAPVETKQMPPQQRPGQSMHFTEHPGNQGPRPDISMARGAMFNEGGVDIGSQYGNPNGPIGQQSQGFNRQLPANNYAPQPQKRPEMRGPQNTDIDNILAGLKTKSVDIPFSPPEQRAPELFRSEMAEPVENMTFKMDGDDSRISISSLKDMQNATAPKTSRRKNRSDKNTISLDI